MFPVYNTKLYLPTLQERLYLDDKGMLLIVAAFASAAFINATSCTHYEVNPTIPRTPHLPTRDR